MRTRPFGKQASLPWGIDPKQFVHWTVTIMSKTLPNELWLRVMDFIPDHIIFKLSPVNDLFCHVALDRRHRALTLDTPFPYELNRLISGFLWVFLFYWIKLRADMACVYFSQGMIHQSQLVCVRCRSIPWPSTQPVVCR